MLPHTGLEKQRPPQGTRCPTSPPTTSASPAAMVLSVPIGANDALVSFHACARLRWQRNGFNRSPGRPSTP